MQTGYKSTAVNWNCNYLQPRCLWKQCITAELQYLLFLLTACLTLIQWQTKSPKLTSRSKNEHLALAKAKRLKWSLWRTEVSSYNFIYLFIFTNCASVFPKFSHWGISDTYTFKQSKNQLYEIARDLRKWGVMQRCLLERRVDIHVLQIMFCKSFC